MKQHFTFSVLLTLFICVSRTFIGIIIYPHKYSRGHHQREKETERGRERKGKRKGEIDREKKQEGREK